MILEVDYGNTRLKWRVLNQESLQCIARGSALDLQELSVALQRSGCTALSYARICSVRSKSENAQLSSFIKETYKITAIYAQSEAQLSGVLNGYLEPARLGVDRWLAVVAAYTLVKGACVVIDCGTAITVDYVRADGVHLGGCIAPGLKLMSKMLQGGTKIPVDFARIAHEASDCVGRTTEQAIELGIASMLTGFVAQQLCGAEKELGSDFVVVASGGDCDLVSGVVVDAVVQKDIVFTGLAIACPLRAKEK